MNICDHLKETERTSVSLVQRLGCNLIKRGDLLLSLVVSYKSREKERITMARIDSVRLNTIEEGERLRQETSM